MEAEVGIVGAGAAGGVLALELARRGIQVVVLESGPRHDFARRGESVRRYLRHENPWPTLPRELDRYTVGGWSSISSRDAGPAVSAAARSTGKATRSGCTN